MKIIKNIFYLYQQKFIVKCTLKKALEKQSKTLTSLMNENRLSKILIHPNILRIFYVFDSQHYIHQIIEQLSGEDLESIIKSKAVFTEKDAATIISELLQAVGFMHSKKVIHRDLKPENIFIRESEKGFKLKIISYDLAVINAGQIETQCCGSPGFMAPEMLRKQGYSFKADIYSCGIILYILLTGITPFRGATTAEILNANCHSIIEYWNDISEEAKDLVMNMTNRDQFARYSAQQCLDHPWFKTASCSRAPLIFEHKNLDKLGKAKEISPRNIVQKEGEILTSSPLLRCKELKMLTTTQFPLKQNNSSAALLPEIFKREMLDLSQKNEDTKSRKSSIDVCKALVEIKPPSRRESSDPDIPSESENVEASHKNIGTVRRESALNSFSPGKNENRQLPVSPGALAGARRMSTVLHRLPFSMPAVSKTDLPQNIAKKSTQVESPRSCLPNHSPILQETENVLQMESDSTPECEVVSMLKKVPEKKYICKLSLTLS